MLVVMMHNYHIRLTHRTYSPNLCTFLLPEKKFLGNKINYIYLQILVT